MHTELKTATHDQERRLVEQALEQQARTDGLSNHFAGLTNRMQAEGSERESREGLRYESLSGQMEVEVKRVATAQSEQEVRFTSQLGELRQSIGTATSKLSKDCDLLRQEASMSSMNLQEESSRQQHR